MGAVTKVNSPPFTSLIRRCPATILAARRTDRVIGRIRFLISSITTIKGMRTPGVPAGTKWDKNLLIALRTKPTSVKNQTQTANLSVKEILLEGVKVYGVNPMKFMEQQNINSQVKNPKLHGITFSLIGILNSLYVIMTGKVVSLLNRLKPKTISELQ